MRGSKDVCIRCGGDNIKQEISFMMNPNTYDGSVLNVSDGTWEDHYYCDDCEDVVYVHSIPNALERAPVTCDQCVAAMINGVFCHEHGCPNT